MRTLEELLERLARLTCCDVAIHSPRPEFGSRGVREWEVIIQDHASAETRVIARGRTLGDAVTAGLAQAQAIGLR